MTEHNFAIFKNTKKTKDNDPDYTISIKWDGEYRQCGKGWIKDAKNGKFISCSLEKPWKNFGGWAVTRLAPENTKPEQNSFDDIRASENPDPTQIPF